jgi:tyrosyl-tRNA synthetase
VAEIIEDLRWRGLIADSTDIDQLADQLAAGSTVFYCGFDPTAPSLHVGNLLQLITMRRLQEAGHQPLALVGGATGLIGDPKESGERTLNDQDTVELWSIRIRAQIERILRCSGASAAQVVNNYEWTRSLGAIDLLRDIGKHFSVNRMLDRESVSARLNGAGISYTEFSYQLLQSYDFVELFRRYGCVLQTGGSDQWGNITAGVDLVRRMTGESVFALTTPLLAKTDGTKFGKTESGTVWLDSDLTSPYAFYQFWLNADDRDVPKWLKTFSLLPQTEVMALIAESEAKPKARVGQRALADELTALVHGRTAGAAVRAASAALFGREDLLVQDEDILAAALTEAGVVDVPSEALHTQNREVAVVDVLAAWTKIGSKGAARRTIKEGGAYVNNIRVSDPDAVLTQADLVHGRWLVLRRGRKAIAGALVPGLSVDAS